MADLTASFRSLYDINMGVKAGERIVVFSDSIRKDEEMAPEERRRREELIRVAEEAAAFGNAVYGSCSFLSFPATSASGAEPPEPLWRAVLGDRLVDRLAAEGILARLLAKTAGADDLARAEEAVQANAGNAAAVVIALANNSTSHTRFRALANRAGARFASLPHFDPAMFLTSMMVDWQALARRTDSLAKAVNQAVSLEVQTPAGTFLTLSKEGRHAEGDTGDLTRPGSFGNLPAGEVYLAPVEVTAEGTLVIEYAPTGRLQNPLTVTIRKGEAVFLEGDDPYRAHLEQKFAENRSNRNIAELGIGTNDRATRPDNVLEAEKILGTIHVALGDNSGFGGTVSTPFHEDFVCYSPTLTAVDASGNRTVLLKTGVLQLPA
jgi:leucyl aminopeptidase (aminopeptidase T)